MIEIPPIWFILAITICSSISFFGGYQIGYGNGSQAEWKMLLKERSKIEVERQEYKDIKKQVMNDKTLR